MQEFFDALIKTVHIVGAAIQERIQTWIEANNLHVRAVVWAGQISKYIAQLCDEYPGFDNFLTVCARAYLRLKSIWYDYKVEPFENQWKRISLLHSRYSTVESSFAYMETYDTDFESTFDTYEESANVLKTMSVLSGQDIQEFLLTIKTPEAYFFQTFHKKSQDPLLTEFPSTVSTVGFLSVEYIHLHNRRRIPLDIEGWNIYAGSRILSPSFVRTVLEYQPKPFRFDLDYEIEIIDNDLTEFRIRADESIRLGESTYEVQKIMVDKDER
jgi:hypothetical protein